MTKELQQPKIGDLVRVEWVDIVSGSMAPEDGLATAWAVGVVAEWDQKDKDGVKRTILEAGAWYDEDMGDKRDKTVLPHGVITSWKIYGELSRTISAYN